MGRQGHDPRRWSSGAGQVDLANVAIDVLDLSADGVSASINEFAFCVYRLLTRSDSRALNCSSN